MKKLKIVEEFKTFANKGDIFDLAVAIVLGAAFNTVVQVLANSILTPVISFFITDISLNDLRTVIRPESVTESGEVVKELAIEWGVFIVAFINFLITALLVFVILKLIRLFKKGVTVIQVRTKEEAKRALEYFDGDPNTPAPRPKKKKRKKGEPVEEEKPAEEEKTAEPTEEEKQRALLSAILENLESINNKLSGGDSAAADISGYDPTDLTASDSADHPV